MQTTITLLITFFTLLLQVASAQKIEAESATLAGGAGKTACATCSGSNIVMLQGGNLTFTVNIATAGYFDVSIIGAFTNTGRPKTNILDIDGKTIYFVYTSTTYSNLNVAIERF